MKSGFKRTTKWNKLVGTNSYLDYIIGPVFQGVKLLLVLLFENTTERIVHTKYYVRTVKMKDYNVMIDGRNFFDQPVKNNVRTYDKIRKIVTGPGDDYMTNCFLD